MDCRCRWTRANARRNGDSRIGSRACFRLRHNSHRANQSDDASRGDDGPTPAQRRRTGRRCDEWRSRSGEVLKHVELCQRACGRARISARAVRWLKSYLASGGAGVSVCSAFALFVFVVLWCATGWPTPHTHVLIADINRAKHQ